MHTTSAALPRPGVSLPDWLATARGPALYALRLWASVCLALYLAFWLQLDNPAWAGGTAAIVCTPQLGASLRKGWFRMIGTVIGAVAIVVLTGLFPQDRIAYLGGLALWCGVCAFGATVLRNFASYSAALAGYTAAIVAADTLGATGGASPSVFLLAVDRATEICLGIACAGVVLAGTDLGGAQRQLAVSFAGLASGIAGRFVRMLSLAGPQSPDTQDERREFARRVIALEPVIDQTIGESSHIRYHSPVLQSAVSGLLSALNGWRGVAAHLSNLRDDAGRQGAQALLRTIPPELIAAQEPGLSARWLADPLALRDACAKAVQSLLALPAATPSLRLLADESAKVLAGMAHALDGLALLVDAPGRPSAPVLGFRIGVADWLPAFINGARAFLAMAAAALFWVVTAWPNGGATVAFAAVLLLLLSPRGDLAYKAAVAASLGAVVTVLCVAGIKFAVLPALETFTGLCLAIGLVFLPFGFIIAYSKNPAVVAVATVACFFFLLLLSPTNQMNYDMSAFYNSALSIIAGCTIGPIAFRLMPPLAPEPRTRRLLSLTLRDLRRLAMSPDATSEDWESRVYTRLEALPNEAEPLQRAQLLAALPVGAEIIRLREMAPRLGVAAEFDAAFEALAKGSSTIALARLRLIDRRLAADPGADALRARSRILMISEALSRHADYFDTGVDT